MTKKPTYEELEKRIKDLAKETAALKRSDEELKESEERYCYLIESAHDMIQSIRSDGSFEFVNRAWLEALGYTEGELPSLNLFDIIHPDSLQHCQEVFSKIMAGQRVTDIQAVFVVKDGKAISVEGSASPRFIGGKFVATHAIFRDNIERKLAHEALRKAHDELEMRVDKRTAKLAQTNERLKQEIKEHKRTEETLRESEERFQQVAENAEEWIWEVDDNGLYTYASPVVEKILGYKPEEIVGKKHFYDLFHPEDREQLKKAAFEIFAKKESFHKFINRNIHKNGKAIWLSTSGVPDIDKKGSLLGYRGADSNITERKQAEEALQESERRFRVIFETAQDSIFLKDRSLRYIQVNPAMERLFELPAQKLIGKNDDELFGEQAGAHIREIDSRVLKGEIIQEEHTKPVGEIPTTFHVIKVPIRDDNGEVTGLCGIARDITDRKRAEETLQESEEKYRSLVESTENSIYLVDRNFRYLFANKKYLSRFNFPIDKVKGRTYSDFHSKAGTQDFTAKVHKVFETGQSLSYEYQSERDGRYFIRTLSPVKEQNGRTISVTVISKDITDRKQAEENLIISKDKLLKEHNQRRILSKRLIDLLEKDRHEIAMELHDHIGQVLTSLKINLEMIDSQLKPTDAELGFHIKAAKEKAISAIKDIVNVSHGLRPGMLDALGLVSSLEELFSEIQENSDIQIKFFIRNVPKRFAPEKELAIYRIVQEALNNIVKHAKAKKVFVNLVKKGGALSLSVEDDGIGFDQDRTMKTTRPKGPLGLLIMRERAIQIDGEFTIESQIEKGTHILVGIPL